MIPDKHRQREQKTVFAMIQLFCKDHHPNSTHAQCPTCTPLRSYVQKRLEFCSFGSKKPTCAKCPIHCYGPTERKSIREVMRYAGPRMLFRHPLLAILHILDGWRR